MQRGSRRFSRKIGGRDLMEVEKIAFSHDLKHPGICGDAGPPVGEVNQPASGAGRNQRGGRGYAL